MLSAVSLQVVVWVDPLDGTNEFTAGTTHISHFVF